MDKYYVLVAGNGETSRANLEALMEDHYYANGENGILVLAFNSKPNKTQEFAAQFAKDKNKDIVLFSKQESEFGGLSNASVTVSENPISDAIEMMKGEKSSAFLLWTDEDEDSSNALAACKKYDIPCFDLTDGLSPIKPADTAVEVKQPVIPKQEANVSDEEIEEEDDDEEFDEEDEEEEDDVEVMEGLYVAIQDVCKMIAKAVVEEMRKDL